MAYESIWLISHCQCWGGVPLGGVLKRAVKGMCSLPWAFKSMDDPKCTNVRQCDIWDLKP